MWLQILIVLVQSVTVASEDVSDFAEKLVRSDSQTVAVFHEVLEEMEDGSYRYAMATQQSLEEMKRIHQSLQSEVGERVKLIGPVAVSGVSWKFDASEISKDDAKRKILQSVNADALIIALRIGQDGGLSKIRLITWSPGVLPNLNGLNQEVGLLHSVSDLAFSGESFELRRWEGDRLSLTGFKKDALNEDNQLYGLGHHFECIQASQMRRDLPHPLADHSCPFKLAVRVNGAVRKLHAIDNKYYVALNESESPEIFLHNPQSHPLMIGVYVDGENTIGKKREHPLSTPSRRHWSVHSKMGCFYRFYHPDRDTEQRLAAQSVSANESRKMGDPAGMITLLIYTDGTPGIEVPSPPVRRGVDLEGGEEEPANIRKRRGKKGLLLAGITVFYRTTDELNSLLNRHTVSVNTIGD